jgi:hypothetical protein
MQKQRMRGESAKQVAIDVLRTARKPLHTKEIAKARDRVRSLLRPQGQDA